MIHKCTTVRHAKVSNADRLPLLTGSLMLELLSPRKEWALTLSAWTVSNVRRLGSCVLIYTTLTRIAGAGHPGEEDIGGLVLVSALVSSDLICLDTVKSLLVLRKN